MLTATRTAHQGGSGGRKLAGRGSIGRHSPGPARSAVTLHTPVGRRARSVPAQRPAVARTAGTTLGTGNFPHRQPFGARSSASPPEYYGDSRKDQQVFDRLCDPGNYTGAHRHRHSQLRSASPMGLRSASAPHTRARPSTEQERRRRREQLAARPTAGSISDRWVAIKQAKLR